PGGRAPALPTPAAADRGMPTRSRTRPRPAPRAAVPRRRKNRTTSATGPRVQLIALVALVHTRCDSPVQALTYRAPSEKRRPHRPGRGDSAATLRLPCRPVRGGVLPLRGADLHRGRGAVFSVPRRIDEGSRPAGRAAAAGARRHWRPPAAAGVRGRQ